MKITIKGGQGEGKTKIAKAIMKLLHKEFGMAVEVIDGEDAFNTPKTRKPYQINSTFDCKIVTKSTCQ